MVAEERRLRKTIEEKKTFSSISVKSKLLVIFSSFFILLLVMLFASAMSMNLLSAMRTHVGGESLWSKSQKDSFYFMEIYMKTGDEEYYKKFEEEFAVPMGISKFYLEVLKADDFNKTIAYEGMREGSIHPDDFDDTIFLVRGFRGNEYIEEGIVNWKKAYSYLLETKQLGEKIHNHILSNRTDGYDLDSASARLSFINEDMRIIEDSYSFLMGEASRWLKRTLTILMVAITLVIVTIMSMIYYIIPRRVLSNLYELKDGTDRISKGDFTRKVPVKSSDEIGELSKAFNSMMGDLSSARKSLIERTNEAESAKADLSEKNYELEKFNKLAVGRELKMVELKRKISRLEGNGKKVKRKSDEIGTG